MQPLSVPIALSALLASFDGTMPVEGEIALDDMPLCDYFVVKTDLGFSFLVWHGGNLIVFGEGERIRGPLHSVGVQDFEVPGGGDIRALVKEWGVGLRRAQKLFADHCARPRH